MKLAIHFGAPEGDPLKLPRPVFLEKGDDDVVVATGGELPGKLIGLLNGEAPTTFGPEEWIDMEDIVNTGPVSGVSLRWRGWYPAAVDGDGISTILFPVDRVEVLA